MDSDLGEFLRSRRARIQPAEAGLREYGRRRVPGLRREEVAQLAGVSVDYYIRLEQGRGRNASDAVLDAVARALRLTDSERLHLYALARPSGTHLSGGGVYQATLRPGARLVLDSIAAPAFVLGRRMDVIAWNALGDKVSGFSSVPAAERNQARYLFLNPAAPDFYPDWETVAVETVAFLRRDAGLHPDDPALPALVDELTTRSAEFRRIWTAHPVEEKTHGSKRIRHTRAGMLEMGYESLLLPGDPDQLLVIYTAVPGSATAAALAALAESDTTAHV
ncbi:helix-turn-helix domain-containing protein [Nocardia sp. SYP-A9097]|uniref:helix-turn-helix transcriptional regulator n=1 Tax=Nocardia sp. SYP-A9097 TaxID=2663237 RepID=UPI00129BDB53|nr:helix-turn-helix transcriptional regulator [Nocardia sp. SYP-A9097]MRH91348.1 helix-turn-helix domain-containing protein [Nocardia sp. SYP-A9097]